MRGRVPGADLHRGSEAGDLHGRLPRKGSAVPAVRHVPLRDAWLVHGCNPGAEVVPMAEPKLERRMSPRPEASAAGASLHAVLGTALGVLWIAYLSAGAWLLALWFAIPVRRKPQI